MQRLTLALRRRLDGERGATAVMFALLLVGRSRFGWRGRHAVHLIYAGAALLLLAYAGSRFVLEVVMLGHGS